MGTLQTITRSIAERFGHAAGIWIRLSVPAQQVIRAFLRAGAVARARAVPFHPSSIIEEAAFSQLLLAGIIRQPSPGRYYLEMRSLKAAWLPML